MQDGTALAGLPPLEIVAWVGDNIHDFPGGSQELRGADPRSLADFGVRFFLPPNPMYGSWQGNPPEWLPETAGESAQRAPPQQPPQHHWAEQKRKTLESRRDVDSDPRMPLDFPRGIVDAVTKREYRLRQP